MPLYEYECVRCGNKFEKIVKFDTPNPLCIVALKTNRPAVLERCDGETKKLISKSNFQLKGQGWHKDGYTKTNTTEQPVPRSNGTLQGEDRRSESSS